MKRFLRSRFHKKKFFFGLLQNNEWINSQRFFSIFPQPLNASSGSCFTCMKLKFSARFEMSLEEIQKFELCLVEKKGTATQWKSIPNWSNKFLSFLPCIHHHYSSLNLHTRWLFFFLLCMRNQTMNSWMKMIGILTATLALLTHFLLLLPSRYYPDLFHFWADKIFP